MPFLYDNLIATVVGMTVLFILASIQMRASTSSVAQSARSMSLKQAETLATWLEQDLEAMGRNLDDDETVFTGDGRVSNENSPTGATLSAEDPLTFYYREEGDSTTTIEYNVVAADEKTVNGETRRLYELDRLEDGNSDGGSSATLGYFDVQFIDRNAQQTDTESDIQGIRAHFSVVAPFQNNETTLHEVHRMVVVPYTPALQ